MVTGCSGSELQILTINALSGIATVIIGILPTTRRTTCFCTYSIKVIFIKYIRWVFFSKILKPSVILTQNAVVTITLFPSLNSHESQTPIEFIPNPIEIVFVVFWRHNSIIWLIDLLWEEIDDFRVHLIYFETGERVLKLLRWFSRSSFALTTWQIALRKRAFVTYRLIFLCYKEKKTTNNRIGDKNTSSGYLLKK